MKRYYFDIREGDELIHDEEGIQFASPEAAQEEAARSLVISLGMLREAIATAVGAKLRSKCATKAGR